MRYTHSIPSSNFHSYAAALFDFFGGSDISLDQRGNFKSLRLYVSGVPRPYLNQLRTVYGGRVKANRTWVIDEEEAQAFANAIRFFTIRRQETLRLFISACWPDCRELTDEKKNKRSSIVANLRTDNEQFAIPHSFFKAVAPTYYNPTKEQRKKGVKK